MQSKIRTFIIVILDDLKLLSTVLIYLILSYIPLKVTITGKSKLLKLNISGAGGPMGEAGQPLQVFFF